MKMRCRPEKRQILYCVITAIALLILLHPFRHAASYEYLWSTDNIMDNLHVELAANFTSSAIDSCSYEGIISDNTEFSIELADGDLIEGHGIREGGEYAPQECVPNFSTAIIVPYQYTPEELRCFLVYMHTFFRRQKIHYRIFVIEQVGLKDFNRAKLLNIGAAAAMKAGYPCLVLHDIDLLPLSPANIYACTKQPRHMSANIDFNRFVLPYKDYIGGVLSITSKQYKTVNGMSNGFFGWGGENSNFFQRLKEHNLQVCRFDPAKNRYHHMFYSRFQYKSTPDKYPVKGYQPRARSFNKDGLNTLHYTVEEMLLHPLFTQITVNLES